MFDTRQIGMFVNNVRVPEQPYKIDGDCYISAYSSLFDVVNKKILQCIHRKKRLSRRARVNIGWSRQSIRLYLIVLEEGRLYPPAMIRTFLSVIVFNVPITVVRYNIIVSRLVDYILFYFCM